MRTACRCFSGWGMGRIEARSTSPWGGGQFPSWRGISTAAAPSPWPPADNRSGTVTILFGAGNGAFPKVVALLLGTSPSVLVSGDFNGDGQLDLATANGASND